jgi:hypothetical protein
MHKDQSFFMYMAICIERYISFLATYMWCGREVGALERRTLDTRLKELKEQLVKRGGMTDAEVMVSQNVSFFYARKLMEALAAADKNVILNRRSWSITLSRQNKTEEAEKDEA